MTWSQTVNPATRTPAAILRHYGAANFIAAIVAQAVGALLASVLLR